MSRLIDRYYVSYGNIVRKGEDDGERGYYAIIDRFKLSVFEKDKSQSVVSTHKDREEAKRLCELANSVWRD